MTKQEDHSKTLRELLVKLTDETLSPQESETLSELLRTDEKARDAYSQYMDVHALLLWKHTTVSIPGDLVHSGSVPSSNRELPGEEEFLSALGTSSRTTRPNKFRKATSVLAHPAVAASLLIGLIAAWSSGVFNTERPPTVDPSQIVGRLTGCVDCHWADAASAPTENDALRSGDTLALKEGICEITLSSGVQILLEGPVSLQVDSDMLVNLDSGRVTATVPPRAVGFTLEMLDVSVIDLGTEFGAQVDADGSGLVRVLDGKVLIRPNLQDNSQNQQVEAGQVAHISNSLPAATSRVAVSNEPSEDIKFVRDLPSRKVAIFQDGLNGYEETKATFIRDSVRESNPGVKRDQHYNLMDNFGSSKWLFVDECESLGTVPEHSRVLLEFPGLFGEENHQIPPGAKITSAFLQLHVPDVLYSDSASLIGVHDTLVPWDEEVVSWFIFGDGGSPGEQYEIQPVTTFLASESNTFFQVDVTKSVRAWANGKSNFGWTLIADGDDRGQFDSDDVPEQAFRPKLIVNFQIEKEE